MLKLVIKRHDRSFRRNSSSFRDELAHAGRRAKRETFEPLLSDPVVVNYLRLFPSPQSQITIKLENDANLRKDQVMLHNVLITLSILPMLVFMANLYAIIALWLYDPNAKWY